MPDTTSSIDRLAHRLGADHAEYDITRATGRFHGVCRTAQGEVLWEEEFSNILTTAGKNFLLDTTLAGSAYTASSNGPFMGLISSTTFSATAITDTMAVHSGWLEAGSANTPTFSGTRLTCVWSGASAGVKALSTGLVFTFTGSGTVQGAFIVLGTGATSAIANTGGTLYSAGTLTTAQPVISTNTLTLSYSTTLT